MDKIDYSNIDVVKLHKCFLECDADNRSLRSNVSFLENENKHLREVISSLLDTIKSFGHVTVG